VDRALAAQPLESFIKGPLDLPKAPAEDPS
jgi:hypothetical protein